AGGRGARAGRHRARRSGGRHRPAARYRARGAGAGTRESPGARNRRGPGAASPGCRRRPPEEMTAYREFHRRSLAEREAFWAEQAKLIDWQKPFTQVLDYSRPPFSKWFVGGRTNLCHNAVDRHLAARGSQDALVWISTEVDQQKSFTYKELFREVNVAAA